MSSTKLGNIVAITGTYTDRGGNEKKRYTRIGVMFQGDDGGFFDFFDGDGDGGGCD